MENLNKRFDVQNGGKLYDYSQSGGKNKNKKYKSFKELYLKTQKELDEANLKIKELENKLKN